MARCKDDRRPRIASIGAGAICPWTRWRSGPGSAARVSHKFETCKTNPSLGVLWKIAAGLGVPFAELIGEGQTGIAVLRRDDSRVLRSTDHKLESRPLMPRIPFRIMRPRSTRARCWRHLVRAHLPGRAGATEASAEIEPPRDSPSRTWLGINASHIGR